MVLPATASLQDRVLALVKTLQFAWFTGHLLTLFGALHYVLSALMFNSKVIPYRIAYFGAVLSYSVVIYKSLGTPQLNIHFARKLVMDENSQYLILAIFWLFSSPITVTLIPYFTFSTFHSLDYVRTNIIPSLFPRPTAAASGDNTPATWQANTQRQIKSLYDQYYAPAMRFVAQAEVTVIVIRLFLGVFRLQIIPFLLYTQFLRFRYHLSVYTRQAFAELRAKFDVLLLSPHADPRIPAFVPKAYVSAKGFISKFGETQQQPEPTPAQ